MVKLYHCACVLTPNFQIHKANPVILPTVNICFGTRLEHRTQAAFWINLHGIHLYVEEFHVNYSSQSRYEADLVSSEYMPSPQHFVSCTPI